MHIHYSCTYRTSDSLTMYSAILAFRTRRGQPSTIRNDSCANMECASKELKQILKAINQSNIQREMEVDLRYILPHGWSLETDGLVKKKNF